MTMMNIQNANLCTRTTKGEKHMPTPNRNTQLFGFNIAPLNASTGTFTLPTGTDGHGNYGEWTDTPTSVSLRLEPYQGDTQILVEWRIDPNTLPADQFLSVMQGIRHVAEKLKVERGNMLTGVKVIVTDETRTDRNTSAHALRTATVRAFENALANTSLVPFSQQVV